METVTTRALPPYRDYTSANALDRLEAPHAVDLYPHGLDTPASMHAFADELDIRAMATRRESDRLSELAHVARRRAERMARELVAS